MRSWWTTHNVSLTVWVLSSNFELIGFRFLISEILQFLDFGNLAWKCLFTPLMGGYLGHISPGTFTHRDYPKKDRPWAKSRHKAWISATQFELGVGRRKDRRTGQGRKKVTKGLYFTHLGRSPYWSDLHQKLCSRWYPQPDHVCQISKWNFEAYRFRGGRIFLCDRLFITWPGQYDRPKQSDLQKLTFDGQK